MTVCTEVGPMVGLKRAQYQPKLEQNERQEYSTFLVQMDITYSQIQHLQAANYTTKYDRFFLISDTMLSHVRARSKLIFFSLSDFFTSNFLSLS